MIDKILRPIGTEFEIDLGVDTFSNDPRGRRIKYRVVGHTVIRQDLMEEIEEVSTEYYDVDHSKYVWKFTYPVNQ